MNADRGLGSAEEWTTMNTDTDTFGSAAADAVAAPLDLLLTDAVFGALRRVNPGGSDLGLAAALATRLPAGRRAGAAIARRIVGRAITGIGAFT